MKNLLSVLMFVFCFYKPVISQINFVPITSVNDIQSTQKIIYLDFYTDWCMPCKKMELECFSDPIIAEYFNKNFVSFRINAETDTGKIIAEKYNVKSYPTNLFLNITGKEIARYIGYSDKNVFVSNAKKVSTYNWNEEVPSDKNSLYNKILLFDSLGFHNSDLLKIYFSKLKPSELSESKNIEIILKNIPKFKVTDQAYLFVIQNIGAIIQDTITFKKAMELSIGKNHSPISVMNLLAKPIYNSLEEAKSINDIKSFELNIKLLKSLSNNIFPNDTSKLANNILFMQMDFYSTLPKEQVNKYKNVIFEFINQYQYFNADQFVKEHKIFMEKQMKLNKERLSKMNSQQLDHILGIYTEPIKSNIEKLKIASLLLSKLDNQEEKQQQILDKKGILMNYLIEINESYSLKHNSN